VRRIAIVAMIGASSCAAILGIDEPPAVVVLTNTEEAGTPPDASVDVELELPAAVRISGGTVQGPDYVRRLVRRACVLHVGGQAALRRRRWRTSR
jgi:hypothetical protein